MRVTREEEIAHIYQIGLEFMAKVSLIYRKEELAGLQLRFEQAAAEVHPQDEADREAAEALASVAAVYLRHFDEH